MSEQSQPVTIKKAGQWDVAFGQEMTENDVERLLKVPPFSSMDPESFPARTPLKSILLNETRIVKYEKDSIILRQGDFGSSAFLILSGSVSLVLNLDDSVLGRYQKKRKSFTQALKQWWTNSDLAEVRDIQSYANKSKLMQDNDSGIEKLANADQVLGNSKTRSLKAGALFGEISALTRAQHPFSVIAENNCTILEIKWQGLRNLMNHNRDLRIHIEKLYRKRSLNDHLLSIPLLSQLNESTIKEISSKTNFQSYGSFDWHVSFKSLINKSQSSTISSEPLIVREGEYADDLIIIRSGFARVSKQYNNGHRTIGYLSQGDVFELNTLVHNVESDSHKPYQTSLRALGYADVLKIPSSVFKQYLLKEYKKSLKDNSSSKDNEFSNDMNMNALDDIDLMNFFVDNRFINGTKTMLINLDRCVGCDDCVNACANAHDGNPRFIRHGERHDKYMVANACMHCKDPVCMIGCPTGAINRSYSGEVIINDLTCIGCATCANSCPYNNIRMVNVRNDEGTLLLDEKFNPIVKATKCDLCIDQAVTPSCEYACPHDALKRIDLKDLKDIKDWAN